MAAHPHPGARRLSALHRVARSVVLALAIAWLLIAALYLLPSWPRTLMAGFSLWVLLPAWLILDAASALRSPVAMGLAAVPALLHLWLVAPDYLPGATAPQGPRLRVVSSNLLVVHPDPAPLAKRLLDLDADVIFLQEFSPRWSRVFREAGVLERYPHRIEEPRDDSFGQAMYSRVPIRDFQVIDLRGVPMISAQIPFDGVDITLLNVHTLPPLSSRYHSVWKQQMLDLKAYIGPRTALLGDFNATQRTPAFVALRNAGLHQAHRECGRSTMVSFPNGVFVIPPVRLDHALLGDDLACASIDALHNTGSDHSTTILELARRR